MPKAEVRRTVPLVLVAAALLTLTAGSVAGDLRVLEPRSAPTLELSDLSGGRRSLADWRGQVVLLNFWAGWCQPCVEEMPSIQRLAERMAGRPFAVVGVNVAEGSRRAARVAAQVGLKSPVLVDTAGATFRAWGGKVLPTSALIDVQGRLRYLGLGPLEWDDAEAVSAVEGLLGEKDEPGPGDGG